MTENLDPFHLALPVYDLAETRKFYGGILGLPEGRSADHWIDYDLFGHQVVMHLMPGKAGTRHTNPVDGDNVPVPHFGIVVSMEKWEFLAEKLKGHGVKFVIEPHIRFKGQVGEQATMFFLDPSGNAMEFKAFKDRSKLFAK
jgi:extradiol dioxygenase family protein